MTDDDIFMKLSLLYVNDGGVAGALSPAEGVGAYCEAFFGGALFRPFDKLRDLNTCCLRVYFIRRAIAT